MFFSTLFHPATFALSWTPQMVLQRHKKYRGGGVGGTRECEGEMWQRNKDDDCVCGPLRDVNRFLIKTSSNFFFFFFLPRRHMATFGLWPGLCAHCYRAIRRDCQTAQTGAHLLFLSPLWSWVIIISDSLWVFGTGERWRETKWPAAAAYALDWTYGWVGIVLW